MNQKPHRPKLEPRKQATQARSVRTVEIILDAAAHILERDGLGGYTTNAIAERAGVSIGSLYQYFPNKDAITFALIDRESAGLVADIVAATSDPDWCSALAAMVRATVKNQLRCPQLMRLLDFEEGRLPNPKQEKRLTDVVHPAVVFVLQRAQLASHHSLAIIAFDLMAIARGMTDAAGVRGETDAEALQRRVMRAVFGYIGAREPA